MVRILCIHDVVPDQARSPWEVRAADLEALLVSLLARGYRLCDPDELAAAGANGVAVTIDDAAGGAVGWLLERAPAFALRAALFPVIDWLDHPPPRSPDHSYRSLAAWRDIEQVQDRGHVIGSHGMSHRALPALGDEAILYELQESKRRLETACGIPVNHFAAPFGKLSRGIIAQALALGYRTVGSTLAGVNRDQDLAKGVLKRFVIRSDLPGLGIADRWGTQ